MNTTQRTILIIASVIIFIMLLFPPYNNELPGGSFYRSDYKFILKEHSFAVINGNTLISQIIAITIICALLCVAFKSKK